MHETSIVQSLIEQVREELDRAGRPGRVVRIDLAIGRLSGVHVDAVRFAFHVLAEGTVVEGAELRIREPKAILRCDRCGAATEVEELELFCPRCGSDRVFLEGGRELLLESIELDQRLEL